MKIKFSDHALEQMKRREISQELVLRVVKRPKKIDPSFRGRMLLQGKFNDKILEVVIKDENDTVIIITAYYL